MIILTGLIVLVLIPLVLLKRRSKGKTDPRVILTARIKHHYKEIERAKRITLRPERIPVDLVRLLDYLGQEVCRVGVHTTELEAHEIFATIFLVNKLFHQGSTDAENAKNFLQRTIVLYHFKTCRKELITSGKYKGTYEFSLGPWSTHLPRAVVECGKLERRGKPSVKNILGLRRRRSNTGTT